MDLFATESQVVQWETTLAGAAGSARLEPLTQLAWHLRQRKPARARQLATELRTMALQLDGPERLSRQSRADMIDGESLWLEARLDEAAALARQCIQTFSKLNQDDGLADAYWLLAWICLDGGKLDDFRTALSQMRAAGERLGDAVRIDIADVLRARWDLLHDLRSATEKWQDRFPEYQAGRHPALEALVQDYYGTAAHQSSNYGEAARHLMRTYELSLDTGQIRAAIIAATNTAEGLNRLNDHKDALEWVQRGLALARPTKWPRSVGACLMHMADTQRCLGRRDAALELLHEALEQLTPIRQSRTYAIALQYLGDLALDRCEYDQALNYFLQLEARGEALDQTDFQIDSRRGQAHALAALGRPHEALQVARRALELAQRVGDGSREIASLRVLADIHARTDTQGLEGFTERPLSFLNRAVEVAQGIAGYTVAADLLEAIAKAHAAEGHHEMAYRTAIEALEARARTQSQEATNRAVAMEIMYQTERARTIGEYHRQLADIEARRSDTLQHTLRTLEQLGEVGLEVTAHLDAQAIFNVLYRHIQILLDATSFAIYLVSSDGMTLERSFGMERKAPLPLGKVDLQHPTAGSARCARERREILLEFQPESQHAPLEGSLSTQSALFSPLMAGEQLLGVMSVQSLNPHAYGERERLIFRTLCAYGAIALDNANTYNRLKLAQEQLVAKEKLAALGGMVAGVAHELNTPIGNGMMIASTLSSKITEMHIALDNAALRKSELKTFLDESREAMRLMQRGLQQAADLVASFKQVAVDRTTAQRRTFNLSQVTHEIAATMMNQVRKAGHTLDIDIAPDIEIDAYPGPFGQILTNFISNSLKHAFEGRNGGHILITAHQPKPDRVLVAFSDDGVGIPPANLPRVFEPFFTTKMGQGGSGLGLSISYNIATAILGGTLTVESVPGQGCKFLLDIPKRAPVVGDDEGKSRGFH